MSRAAPHFSAAWLAGYRRRLDGKPTAARAPVPAPCAHAPAHACEPACAAPSRPYAPADSRALPLRGWTGKQTETEKRYNRLVLAGAGRFEAVTLHLPGGGRYTPDFMTLDEGTVTFHEVKGSYRLASQGRALTAFQEAVAAFPCFRFVWAVERAQKGVFDRRVFAPAETGV